MSSFRVVALPEELSRAVRETGRAPGYGHQAQVEPATGYGPCRSCLKQFRQERENRILFTFDAFAGLVDYPSPGPVFIHEDECSAFAGPGFPNELRSLPLVLEGYGRDRWLMVRERPAQSEIETTLSSMLADDEVDYVHLRNGEAGCYIARVERV
ncbi:MAG: DUF1203 domain-containing protein [Acidobacteriota bacterium]